ncbi:MAG: trypsin-like serine protease [Allosphingosinicella sp.]
MPQLSKTSLPPLLVLAACSVSDDGARAPMTVTASAAPVSQERSYTIWRNEAEGPAGHLIFRPLAEVLPSGQVELDHGIEVRAADWPATLIADLSGGGYCTASLIGPRALLTAAHCVDLGKAPGSPPPLAGGGEVRIQGRVFQLSCEIEPSYTAAAYRRGQSRASADYALCTLPASVDLTRLAPESISTQALPVGRAILMAGYGCTNISIDQQGQLNYTSGDGKLRMGDERISFVGDKAADEAVGVYVTTQNDSNEPTLCPGDSGGPVFIGATLASQTAPERRIAAVNSAVGWSRRSDGSYRYYSFLTPLATPAFQSFLTSFVSRNDNLVICGHNRNPGIGGCRG